ncbi:hypothetical protein CPAR01_07176 [Colletotrichum paranaense]|uniref:protein-ribulosamine 3-kinase n=1 Tax=Colletotrichum paranaense TaxID=1914294 RepID=A0ABQ9SNU4_9PEZI|nr:uncharacterized protein CPAR01_07176 [Colletotrichum paranaense]KAK1541187.1 hypothetical protein CPAR01_07176 [Colletotrichum paranaense]
MKTSTALVTGSQTDIKGNLIESYESNVTNVDVNVVASLVPFQQQNVDVELHLTNQKLRAGQNAKFPQTKRLRMIEIVSIQALPKGFSIHSAQTFGNSAWTITGKIVARSSSSEKAFFVKTAYGEPAEFVDFDTTTAQDPSEFCQRLPEMHQKSLTLSDKFGFSVTTCDGDRPHVVEWESDWAVFYRKLFLHTLSLDIKKNGTWSRYERAAHQVADLIHGDMWEGNTSINKDTNLPMLFDAGSYFAHSEVELGHWACEFSAIF